ncbi:MAG: 30S ribosomal protein S8 [Candidatus Harrisonbacteria bacterium RIFCSPLOWO2_02_FULL_41_11]|uniref:Small ribosomal subunit protein uS8 n=1 Tax=Candidatus Harrisonbacteria bacterium RIFCSPHIGHO2_02_FULL_42_16 TaxID=1798404 RepID=A0A1G1ZK02_9BACT|nr:MAG: 30S ribosomal protein S8 [Candidatus Harrisonbacteria bacterium RIFCSPHIGHO2_02_FULL_42_16]OGY67651.1 MAG: 30S ribosomal protein S8 [Candidatus Harrisonbacteria bacterium RIFCSPLOWO2_02_FULL_41_11]
MYTDLLTKIKNAQSAKKTGLKTYYSNMDFAILEVLVKHKFLQDVSKKGRMPKRAIDITLKYKDGEGAISGLKFLSSPSRRLYLGYKDIKSVRQGYGLLILSTPKGIMDGRTAKKNKLGGQLLFEVW